MENKTKKDVMLEKMREKKHEARLVRRIVFSVVLVLLLIATVGGFSGYTYIQKALKPIDPNATEVISVNIPIGSSLDSIANILQQNNIIKNAKVFKYYAKFNNAGEFQAGDYELTQAMTFDELIESLKTGKVYREPMFKLTVREGVNLEEIGDIIEEKTDYTKDEFMSLVTDETFINSMMEKYPTLLTEEIKNDSIRYDLEGYLFPATYSFYEKNPALETIVEQMIKSSEQAATPYIDILAEKGHTIHWLMTFSSLLEKEATQSSDRATIASVFYNRMEIGMPLQTDPTVLYALGKHKDRVLLEDLEVDNPYNTYKVQGLPPGPIANFGAVSIEAVMNAPDTSFFYFLADSNGVNHFAETYEEHLENKAKYID